jgi:hypothetical protein
MYEYYTNRMVTGSPVVPFGLVMTFILELQTCKANVRERSRRRRNEVFVALTCLFVETRGRVEYISSLRFLSLFAYATDNILAKTGVNIYLGQQSGYS